MFTAEVNEWRVCTGYASRCCASVCLTTFNINANVQNDIVLFTSQYRLNAFPLPSSAVDKVRMRSCDVLECWISSSCTVKFIRFVWRRGGISVHILVICTILSMCFSTSYFASILHLLVISRRIGSYLLCFYLHSLCTCFYRFSHRHMRPKSLMLQVG